MCVSIKKMIIVLAQECALHNSTTLCKQSLMAMSTVINTLFFFLFSLLFILKIIFTEEVKQTRTLCVDVAEEKREGVGEGRLFYFVFATAPLPAVTKLLEDVVAELLPAVVFVPVFPAQLSLSLLDFGISAKFSLLSFLFCTNFASLSVLAFDDVM